MENEGCLKNYCGCCKKSFCSPGGLKRHLKTAKYCMEARGDLQISSYCCKWCHQTFNQNWYLNKHLQTCQEKQKEAKNVCDLENEIKKLKQIILEKDAIIIDQKLKIAHDSGKVEVLENIKPQKIINNNETNGKKTVYVCPKVLRLPITHISPLTKKVIQEYIKEFYDCYVFEEGYDGLCGFTRNLLYNNDNDYGSACERNLVCSNKINNAFYKLDYNNIKEMKEWVTDGVGLSIHEILNELVSYTHICFKNFNEKKNVTEEEKQLALETYEGITSCNSKARRILFKRLRGDLKQYLTI